MNSDTRVYEASRSGQEGTDEWVFVKGLKKKSSSQSMDCSDKQSRGVTYTIT